MFVISNRSRQRLSVVSVTVRSIASHWLQCNNSPSIIYIMYLEIDMVKWTVSHGAVCCTICAGGQFYIYKLFNFVLDLRPPHCRCYL